MALINEKTMFSWPVIVVLSGALITGVVYMRDLEKSIELERVKREALETKVEILMDDSDSRYDALHQDVKALRFDVQTNARGISKILGYMEANSIEINTKKKAT